MAVLTLWPCLWNDYAPSSHPKIGASLLLHSAGCVVVKGMVCNDYIYIFLPVITSRYEVKMFKNDMTLKGKFGIFGVGHFIISFLPHFSVFNVC